MIKKPSFPLPFMDIHLDAIINVSKFGTVWFPYATTQINFKSSNTFNIFKVWSNAFFFFKEAKKKIKKKKRKKKFF
jgi:hypothetical protein